MKKGNVMKYSRVSSIALLSAALAVFAGCVSQEQYEDLRGQNRAQQATITRLHAEVQTADVAREQCQRLLETERARAGVNRTATADEVAVMEKTIADLRKTIEQQNAMMLKTGIKLPMELNIMLKDFARNSDMITFDEERGILKFKSDLLFDLGSAKVADSRIAAIQSLAGIMKSPEAADFDVVIAGHTDDVPIGKPETRAQHPTNWHLSVHRGISVLNIMSQNGVEPTRLSVRGFGEFRPAAPNAPGNKGNEANRRVEMYIVPKGA